MKKWVPAAVLAATVTVTLQAQQTFQFFVSLTDPAGTVVESVMPADLDVKENGMSGKVTSVEPITWPIKVQLLVDNGAGLGPENLVALRNGMRGFLEALPEGVEVTVVTTAPQPRFVVRPTTNRADLLKAPELLAPDGGAGRFIDSLSEAAQRIDRDKGNYFPVVVALASTAVGGDVTPRVVEQMFQRFGMRATTVHVVMVSSQGRASLTGGNSIDVGIEVAKMTGGRYENISAPMRIATLLPEIGKQVAASHALQSKQFRITFQRPAGMSGDIGDITLGARGNLRSRLSIDGHLP